MYFVPPAAKRKVRQNLGKSSLFQAASSALSTSTMGNSNKSLSKASARKDQWLRSQDFLLF